MNFAWFIVYLEYLLKANNFEFFISPIPTTHKHTPICNTLHPLPSLLNHLNNFSIKRFLFILFYCKVSFRTENCCAVETNLGVYIPSSIFIIFFFLFGRINIIVRLMITGFSSLILDLNGTRDLRVVEKSCKIRNHTNSNWEFQVYLTSFLCLLSALLLRNSI